MPFNRNLTTDAATNEAPAAPAVTAPEPAPQPPTAAPTVQASKPEAPAVSPVATTAPALQTIQEDAPDAVPTVAVEPAPITTPPASVAPAMQTVTAEAPVAAQAAPTIAAPVVVPPVAQAAPTPAPAAATQLIDLAPMLGGLQHDLEMQAEPKDADISLGQLRKALPDLAKGLETVGKHFGFSTGDDALAVRFVAAHADDKGEARASAVYTFSLNAAPSKKTCLLKWGNASVEMNPNDVVYIVGIRRDRPSKIKLPNYTCPIGIAVDNLSDQQKKQLSEAETFAELAPFLKEGAGSNMVTKMPDGFRMLVTSATPKRSRKGNDYIPLMGDRLDENGNKMGECGIFNPASDDYWTKPGLLPCILLYQEATRKLYVYSPNGGEPLDAISIRPRPESLNKLRVGKHGTEYEVVGHYQREMRDKATSWVVSLRIKGQTEIRDYWSIPDLRRPLDNTPKQILEACEQWNPSKTPYEQIIEVDCPDKPWATFTLDEVEKKGDKQYAQISGLTFRTTATLDQARESRLSALGI